MSQRLLLTLVAALLLSCGGDSAPEQSAPVNADVTVLMMGNSHTEANDLPQQLQGMLGARLANRTVAVQVAPGWMFLDERLAHTPSIDLLRSRRWTAVVLQAQKYSSSGQFTYSTQEAEALVRLSRVNGAQPVMFPEWPRRAVDETARIYDIHAGIAQREPACVAPIGQAWDLALARHPGLQLHASDGNHSAPAGAYLTALMLYTTLTAASPLGAPTLANGVDGATQAQLRQVAADTALPFPPRRYCPQDPPLAQPG